MVSVRMTQNAVKSRFFGAVSRVAKRVFAGLFNAVTIEFKSYGKPIKRFLRKTRGHLLWKLDGV